MKKKIISTLFISLIILSLSVVTLFADSYIWVGRCEWANLSNDTITIRRLLRERDDVKFYIYRSTSGSTHIVFYSPYFSSSSLRDNWKNQYGYSYINSISNGNLGSTNTTLTGSSWSSSSYTYTDNTGTHTEYFNYYSVGFNKWFYGGIGRIYPYIEYSNTSSQVANTVCYLYHGYYGNANINDNVSFFQNARYFPYVFGNSNIEGDQRTYDPETSPVKTINIHPEDAFNTYEVNRNTSSTTVDFDTYVLPDAIDINSNVITNNELRYEDVTYNTEFSVSNVNNYYTDNSINGNDNNTGDNGGNGSVNNAGVNITVEENAVNMTQTIEENAVNVTVNNNQNVSQDVANNINQIVNTTNPNGNTFQQTIQDLTGFIGIGNTFSQIASAYLSFLPASTVSLIGITFAIVMFMIILRIIHLFI